VEIINRHRLWGEVEMFEDTIQWSQYPGCFERHLQRRHGNQLFPYERRNVTGDEVRLARKRDLSDQEIFVESIKRFIAEFRNIEDTAVVPPAQASAYLQKVQVLLEEAFSIGGNIQSTIKLLETTEEEITRSLNKAMPSGKAMLEEARSLSSAARIPFLAQSKRKDCPILSKEEVPSLLSEDDSTIAYVGFLSRSFADFRPNESDIRMQIDKAMKEGFSRNDAQRLIEVWNKTNKDHPTSA